MEMFEAGDYGKMPLPDDVTLEMATGFFIHGDVLPGLKKLSRHHRIRIRFLDKEDKECPSTMTMGEFRKLDGGHIVIDDGEGGVPFRQREPELT